MASIDFSPWDTLYCEVAVKEKILRDKEKLDSQPRTKAAATILLTKLKDCERIVGIRTQERYD